MGSNRLSTSITLIIVILLSISYDNVIAQEWLGEMYKSDERISEKSIYDIQNRAKEYFKYAEREYYSRYFEIADYPELE